MYEYNDSLVRSIFNVNLHMASLNSFTVHLISAMLMKCSIWIFHSMKNSILPLAAATRGRSEFSGTIMSVRLEYAYCAVLLNALLHVSLLTIPSTHPTIFMHNVSLRLCTLINFACAVFCLSFLCVNQSINRLKWVINSNKTIWIQYETYDRYFLIHLYSTLVITH